eukprot:9941503-Ditylum_brightwellii.AAC.1
MGYTNPGRHPSSPGSCQFLMVSGMTLADNRNLDLHIKSDNHSMYSSTTKTLSAKQSHPNAHIWKS